MTNGEALEFIAQSIKSDVDMAMVADAIKALEQESTTKNDLGVDAVSRQAVIDLMMQKWGENFSGDDAMQESIDAIRVMPSVTPQEPRWIPCSEKKPDKGGEYLLWGKIDESEEEDYCFIGDYHEFDEVFGTEISNYDPKTLGFIDTEIEEYYSVVAWMPLPKPYEPQESEDKE